MPCNWQAFFWLQRKKIGGSFVPILRFVVLLIWLVIRLSTQQAFGIINERYFLDWGMSGLELKRGLVELESDVNKQRKYIDFIDYYADLSNQESSDYRTHYLTEEDEKMGLAQLLRQEGIQQGKQEECIALVTRLLRRKFGNPPELDSSLATLPTLPLESLEELVEAQLDWIKVSDFIACLQQRFDELKPTFKPKA